MELYRLWPAGLVLLMALLGSCNMGAPESMLAEHAFKEAAGALQLAIGQRTRAFRIDTDDSEFTLQMQDPASPNHIDAWSHYYQTIRNIVSWEGTRGPSAVDPTLINPKLEENLFKLADVDFAAYPKLAQAAIARAGLQDPARVLKVNIQRRIFLIPSPSNGDVRWTLQVSSDRERRRFSPTPRAPSPAEILTVLCARKNSICTKAASRSPTPSPKSERRSAPGRRSGGSISATVISGSPAPARLIPARSADGFGISTVCSTAATIRSRRPIRACRWRCFRPMTSIGRYCQR